MNQQKRKMTAAVSKHTNRDGDARATLMAKYLWNGDFDGANAFMDSKGLDAACLNRPSKPNGTTALQDAVIDHANCKLGLDIATWLLSKGVDVDSAGRPGSIAGTASLYLAVGLNDLAMVQLLLNYDADPNGVSIVYGHGNSSLYLSCQEGFVAVARALIAHGADVEKGDSGDGATPLCVACLKGQQGAAQILLEAGADPNKAKTSGSTPLYFCAQGNYLSIAKLLLKAGAEAGKPAFRGYTPLDVAKNDGHYEMAKLLQRSGAFGGETSCPSEPVSSSSGPEVEPPFFACCL
jgi:ankyrin repeat protein